MQHGLMDYETAVTMLQAISTTTVTPLVRVPWNEPGIIMRMLDAGSYGIICPMINSRAEAERFVSACRYPPAGMRSYGPRRATLYAGSDYPERANDTILAIAMIETADGLANVDEIVALPGLDGLYVGPADLSLSLTGRMRFDYRPILMMVDALERVLVAASRRRQGLIAGLHTGSPEFARRMIEQGFEFVTIQTDAAFLENEASRVTALVRHASESQSGRGPNKCRKRIGRPVRTACSKLHAIYQTVRGCLSSGLEVLRPARCVADQRRIERTQRCDCAKRLP